MASALKQAWDRHHEADGWANVAPVGATLKRMNSDFDPRSFGANNLSELLGMMPDDFEVSRRLGKNKTTVVRMRPLDWKVETAIPLEAKV